MAPSDKKIEEAVLQGTYEVYENDPSDTSVNKVRKYVEEKLSLDDGFFSSGQWKTKSKELIKQRVGELLDGWVPESKDEAKSDTGVKRRSTSIDSPDHKRQKRGPKTKMIAKKAESPVEGLSEEEKPKPVKRKAGRPRTKAKVVEPEDESSLSDLEMEEEEEEEEKSKPERKAPGPSKTKAKVVESEDESCLSDPEMEEKEDDEEEEEEKPKPVKPKAERPTNKAKIVEPEDESSLSELEMEDESMKSEKENAPDDGEVSVIDTIRDSENGDEGSGNDAEKGDGKEDGKKDEPPAPVDQEEEYSDVIDEPVKPKRKKRQPKEKKTTTAKATKAIKPARKPSLTSDDPNEVEIKRLQSHLIKCGIRKLWHNELKKYGDDSQAKIRHLKKMLAHVGMDGRFSEAKAREIKERRELLAELEATQEMNELWGINSKGRASRSKSKNTKEESADEGEGGEGGDDDEEEVEEEQHAFAARRRRAQADLAFLGDDRDSD